VKSKNSKVKTKFVNGLLIFDLPPDSPKLTNQQLLELEAKMELEEDLNKMSPPAKAAVRSPDGSRRYRER
jgi:hypothetical protein